MKQAEVSKATISRIPVYLNYLKAVDSGIQNISATSLAKGLGLGEVQVRKDLSACLLYTSTLMKSSSIFKCLSCFACVDRCPRGVEPAKLVEALRLMVIREKGANHLTSNDIPALVDDDLPQQAIVSAMRKYSK